MANSVLLKKDEGMLNACFLGLDKPYSDVLRFMHERHEAVAKGEEGNLLLLLEHRAVITITRQHQERSIITSKEAILLDTIDLVVADRGGDATFHGPGQLVGYPIIKLHDPMWRCHDNSIDIERYIRVLEQSLLRALHALGFTRTLTVPGFTGIWYRGEDATIKLKKVIAIGVGIKNSVTKHGFALNIDIDHKRFSNHITPCGLKDRGVTTLLEIAELEGIAMPKFATILHVISTELAAGFALRLRANLE